MEIFMLRVGVERVDIFIFMLRVEVGLEDLCSVDPSVRVLVRKGVEEGGFVCSY